MGKFVVRQTASGVKFDLKATNGEVIATSEVYSGEQACMTGIESVRNCAPAANFEDQTLPEFETAIHPKFELYQDKSGGFRFRLKARNGQIIAVSESYVTKVNCLNGIESVRKNAADAAIVKEEV